MTCRLRRDVARRSPVGVSCPVIALVIALVLHVAPGLASGEQPVGAEPLPPATILERALANGEQHRYRLQPVAAGDSVAARWLLRVEQIGVDVALSVDWPGAPEPVQVDSPLDRDGVELVLLPSTVEKDAIVTVHAKATAGAPGRYRIRLDRIRLDRADRRQLVALQAVTEAGRAYAAGGGEGRRRALAHYREAAEQLLTLPELALPGRALPGAPRFAAQSLYAVAVLHRLLGEGAEALASAEEVLPRWRALGDAGREADTLNEIGLVHAAADRIAEAREAFRAALDVQERAGDHYRQAATANNLCLTHLIRGEHRQALDCYGPALTRIRAAGDEEHEAVALTNLGWAHRSLGQPEEALDHFQRAAAIHHAAGREKREAEALNNLAVLYRQVAEPEEALARYLRALEIFRRQGDRRWEGTVLHNLGTVYQSLGDPERALVFYRRALQLRKEQGDLRGEANTLKLLGLVELDAGRPREAREFLRLALTLEQMTEDRRGQAVVQKLLGKVAAALGDHQAALAAFELALDALRALGVRRQEVQTLIQMGRSLFALERTDEAAAHLGRAASIAQALGMGLSEADARYRQAEVERGRGQEARSLAYVDEAIELLESLRTSVSDPDLQATFAGRRHGVYELRIALLMARYAASGDEQHMLAALETSEQARAWGLVALLRQTGSTRQAAADPALARRWRTARRKLHIEAARRRKALAKASLSDSDRDEVETAFFQQLAELERLEAAMRLDVPEAAVLTRPKAIAAAGIQRLLEPGTVLLEYSLASDRSYLFRVTTDRVQCYELPARQEIEQATRAVHRVWSASQAPPADAVNEATAAAAALAEMLLAPALDGMGLDGMGLDRVPAKRLVIVADGALHYLPFAALPLPGQTGGVPTQPLLSRYEVVHLPSAAALAAERARNKGRAPAGNWAAVLADPIFDRRDPRLATGTDRTGDDRIGTGVTRGDHGTVVREERQSLTQPQSPALPRLRMSRREAQTIAALASAEDVLVALDADASRSLALGGRLADYRIVHFATHAVIDARYPALSGLALSSFDAAGRPRDGFLRLRDIYGLTLQADLVVLSACRTALGKEVRGEGLLGLTRGFLHAGARRVVASLWSVPDRATAELMARFYRAMVTESLAPPAALRRAQQSMRQQRRWRDPHNWAGFVLLGDWQ